MQPSIIIIIVLGFVALWLVTRNTEHMPSGLDSTTRLNADVGGPISWSPALINAQNVADGSPCRVPYDWVPTADSSQVPCITEPSYPPAREELGGLGTVPAFGP